MKKTVKNKLLAGSMAAILAGGLAAYANYSNPVPEVQAKEEAVEKLEETAREILGDDTAGNAEGLFKDESVYVKTDSTGKVTQTTVTEWLKNPGEGEIADISDLNDIKNIKGDETFSRGDGNTLHWNSEGKDIYYQGTIKKDLPIDMKISYKLDGKPVSAEDLKGRDGKAEIRIDYTNRSKQTAQAGGQDIEMYTPFTVVTALMLPTDEYKNVSIDHGKILSDADKDIVVGVVFPGLKENLHLEDLDLDIPTSITITADVKNASVGPAVTLVSSEILSDLGLNDVNDFDSLASSIDELQDAATQLADGSSELADGVNTLNSKTGDLKSGVNELTDGVNAYTDGVSQLSEGSSQLLAGAGQLKQGIFTSQQAIGSAKAGADELLAGYDNPESGAVAGAQALSQGASDLSQGASALSQGASNLSQGVSAVSQGASDLSQGLSALSQGLEQSSLPFSAGQTADIGALAYGMAAEAGAALPDDVFDAMGMTREDYVNQLSGAYASVLEEQISNAVGQAAAAVAENMNVIKENVSQLSAGAQSLEAGAQDLEAGAQGLEAGAQNLAAGTQSLASGAQSLEAGIGQLRDGTAQLQSGLGQLYMGSDALVQGSSNLYDGTDSLHKGAAVLNESGSLLKTGAQKLQDGGEQLSSGVGILADGANTLSSGMAEFKTSGIDRLSEVFHGDIQNVTSRIDAMTALGQDYKSFAGIKDDMAGSTKFIIETEGVE